MKAKNLLMSLLVAVMFPVALVLSACGPANIGTVEGKNLELHRVTLKWGETATPADKEEAYSTAPGVTTDAEMEEFALARGYYGIVGLNFKADCAVTVTFVSEAEEPGETTTNTNETTYTQVENEVTIPWADDEIETGLTFVVQGAYLTASMEFIDEDTEAVMATMVYYFKVA